MTKGTFVADAGNHFVVVMYPNAGPDVADVTGKIANFNQANFRNVPIEVKTAMFDAENQVIMVKLFQTKQKAMEYYELFLANKDLLRGINDQGLPIFAISAGNYQQFFTTHDLDGYTAFFSRNYLQGQ